MKLKEKLDWLLEFERKNDDLTILPTAQREERDAVYYSIVNQFTNFQMDLEGYSKNQKKLIRLIEFQKVWDDLDDDQKELWYYWFADLKRLLQ